MVWNIDRRIWERALQLAQVSIYTLCIVTVNRQVVT